MIQLQDVTYQAGNFRLSPVTLHLAAGEYAVLMGKTGNGKTTLLELICGLRRCHGGRILIHGTDVTRFPPADRQVGYVPQDLALFPHLTVLEHLEFALRLRRLPTQQMHDRTEELANHLGISPLLKRSVQGLSGGEAQRVALGRALAARPRLLLLDEPLSALDHETRAELQQVLRNLNRTFQITILHVTHNLDEASALATRRLQIVQGQLTELPASNASSPFSTELTSR